MRWRYCLKVGGVDEQARAVGAEVAEGEGAAVAVEQVLAERVGEDVAAVPVAEPEHRQVPRQERVDDQVGGEAVGELVLDAAGVPAAGAVGEEAVVGGGEGAAADGGDVVDALE